MADEKAPKLDGGKAPMHLLVPEWLAACADVLAFGAKKYAPWSWMKGKEWSRDYAAVQRHVTAWWGGEDVDPETGLSHLAHAAVDLMFLLVSQRRGLGTDDRPPRAKIAVAASECVYDLDLKRTLYPKAWKRGGCILCGGLTRDMCPWAHDDCWNALDVNKFELISKCESVTGGGSCRG